MNFGAEQLRFWRTQYSLNVFMPGILCSQILSPPPSFIERQAKLHLNIFFMTNFPAHQIFLSANHSRWSITLSIQFWTWLSIIWLLLFMSEAVVFSELSAQETSPKVPIRSRQSCAALKHPGTNTDGGSVLAVRSSRQGRWVLSVSIWGQSCEWLDGWLTKSAFVFHQSLMHKVVLFMCLNHAASERTQVQSHNVRTSEPFAPFQNNSYLFSGLVLQPSTL